MKVYDNVDAVQKQWIYNKEFSELFGYAAWCGHVDQNAWEDAVKKDAGKRPRLMMLATSILMFNPKLEDCRIVIERGHAAKFASDVLGDWVRPLTRNMGEFKTALEIYTKFHMRRMLLAKYKKEHQSTLKLVG
jgi:hypothetical protein